MSPTLVENSQNTRQTGILGNEGMVTQTSWAAPKGPEWPWLLSDHLVGQMAPASTSTLLGLALQT